MHDLIDDKNPEDIIQEAIELHKKYNSLINLKEAIHLVIKTYEINGQMKIYDYLEDIKLLLDYESPLIINLDDICEKLQKLVRK